MATARPQIDRHLLAWARAAAHRSAPFPPLWLFTDFGRLRDPRAAVASLPRGLAGVVFRHDEDPERLALGRALARICQDRRLILVVAGDARLAAALSAGTHLRGGRRERHVKALRRPITSSAHDLPELIRARRSRADLVFLSPAFATASHPGGRALGVVRWARLAGASQITVAALGGVDGRSVRRLPRRYCSAVGAIGAIVAGAPVT
jgi:thiamine-phosphate pyrophosphorylase